MVLPREGHPWALAVGVLDGVRWLARCFTRCGVGAETTTRQCSQGDGRNQGAPRESGYIRDLVNFVRVCDGEG